MSKREWRVRASLFASLTIGVAQLSAAQGANVDVTVTPAYSAGQAAPPRDGFTVCIGTMTDFDAYGMQLTPTSGVANTAFKNLPTGQQVVVRVNKTGFIGMQQIVTLQADWTNHLHFQPQAGSGGPSCPSTTTTTPSTTPPPTTSPPPSSSPPPTRPQITPGTLTSMQLTLSSFFVGGAANPPALQFGFTTPVYVASAGVTKANQIRLSERADFSDATWQPLDGASYKLSSSGRRTIYAQVRSTVTMPPTVSNTLTDVVDVVVFSAAGVTPPVNGISSRDGKPLERVRLQCDGRNEITTVTGRQGAWLDAIGIRCSGNASVGPVGNLDAPAITVWDISECPVWAIPYYLPIHRVPMTDFMQASKIVGCVTNPVELAGPLPAQAVAGPDLKCPTGSVPLAIDAYLDKVALTGKKYVAGLGLVCIKPGA